MVIFVRKHLEVDRIKINRFSTIRLVFFIFLLMIITAFHSNLKKKITGQTGNDDTKYVIIIVPLKYLSNFGRTLKIPLISCEINLTLTWSENCF